MVMIPGRSRQWDCPNYFYPVHVLFAINVSLIYNTFSYKIYCIYTVQPLGLPT